MSFATPTPRPTTNRPVTPPSPSTSTTTDAFSLESFQFVLREIFDVDPIDSKLARGLQSYGCKSYMDIAGLQFDDIDSLESLEPMPPDPKGGSTKPEFQPVPKTEKSLVKILCGYIYHRDFVMGDPLTDQNWYKLTRREYNDYRCSGHYMVFRNQSIPAPLIAKSTTRSLADDFNRSVKLDPSSYPILSDKKQWDDYNRKLEALCRLHLNTIIQTPIR